MHSFLNAKNDSSLDQEAIFIKTPLQHLLINKSNLTMKKIEKIIALERQHPFLQGQSEMS